VVFFNKFWNGHAIKDGCRGEILSNMMENEQQTILDDKRNMMVDLYNQLHELGLCKTKYEYSTYWLNRSKRYYYSVTNEKRDVSIEPLMYAIARIKTLSDQCRRSTTPLLITKADKLDTIRTEVENRLTRCITDNLHQEK